jgi:acyl carrier protein
LKENIEHQLRDILVQLGELPTDFSSQADLYADLGMPSVKAMQLLLELEDKFGVAIADEDFVEATSLDQLVALISRLQASSNL